MSLQTDVASDRRRWLFSPSADFWLASAGASAGLLAAVLIVFWHGDREIDAVDLVLSEFHLGATYHMVMQRRLWRRPFDILLVPAIIIVLTYALSFSGQAVLLTSIAMYAAVWHRGRQSLGIARFYQRAMGGPTSRTHKFLFGGAIYLPMLAALLAYTHLAPAHYEGEPYVALNPGANFTWVAGLTAVICVVAYLAYAIGRNRATENLIRGQLPDRIHPGEWWVVVGHAFAFGSSYVLGATNASFLFVLAVHHEVQYLYFTYAMSRAARFGHQSRTDMESAKSAAPLQSRFAHGWRSEWRHAAAFSLWPVLGFAGAIAGGWVNAPLLATLGTGGLFCHYWLDSRIWRRRVLAT